MPTATSPRPATCPGAVPDPGVLQHVGVQLLHVVEGGVLAAETGDLGPQGGERSARGRRVRRRHLRLELGVEQRLPRIGQSQSEFVEDGLVRAEAERADVDARPGAVGVLVLLGDRGRVGRHVGLDEVLLGRRTEPVGGPAVPDVELGGALGGREARHGFAGAEAHEGRLDARLGGERLRPGVAHLFHRAAGDGDRTGRRPAAPCGGAGRAGRARFDDAASEGERECCSAAGDGDQ